MCTLNYFLGEFRWKIFLGLSPPPPWNPNIIHNNVLYAIGFWVLWVRLEMLVNSCTSKLHVVFFARWHLPPVIYYSGSCVVLVGCLVVPAICFVSTVRETTHWGWPHVKSFHISSPSRLFPVWIALRMTPYTRSYFLFGMITSCWNSPS